MNYKLILGIILIIILFIFFTGGVFFISSKNNITTIPTKSINNTSTTIPITTIPITTTPIITTPIITIPIITKSFTTSPNIIPYTTTQTPVPTSTKSITTTTQTPIPTSTKSITTTTQTPIPTSTKSITTTTMTPVPTSTKSITTTTQTPIPTSTKSITTTTQTPVPTSTKSITTTTMTPVPTTTPPPVLTTTPPVLSTTPPPVPTTRPPVLSTTPPPVPTTRAPVGQWKSVNNSCNCSTGYYNTIITCNDIANNYIIDEKYCANTKPIPTRCTCPMESVSNINISNYNPSNNNLYKINLSWTGSTNATSYIIKVYDDQNGEIYRLGTVSTNALIPESFNNPIFQYNRNYKVEIIPQNTNYDNPYGSSGTKNFIFTSTPVLPTISNIILTIPNQISLYYKNDQFTNNYNIKIISNNNIVNTRNITSSKDNNLSLLQISELENDVLYNFSINGYNNTTEGPKNTFNFITIPTITSLKSRNQDGIFTWNKINNISGYKIGFNGSVKDITNFINNSINGNNLSESSININNIYQLTNGVYNTFTLIPYYNINNVSYDGISINFNYTKPVPPQYQVNITNINLDANRKPIVSFNTVGDTTYYIANLYNNNELLLSVRTPDIIFMPSSLDIPFNYQINYDTIYDVGVIPYNTVGSGSETRKSFKFNNPNITQAPVNNLIPCTTFCSGKTVKIKSVYNGITSYIFAHNSGLVYANSFDSGHSFILEPVDNNGTYKIKHSITGKYIYLSDVIGDQFGNDEYNWNVTTNLDSSNLNNKIDQFTIYQNSDATKFNIMNVGNNVYLYGDPTIRRLRASYNYNASVSRRIPVNPNQDEFWFEFI